MDNNEIDLDLITREGIDRLLQFLPVFTRPDAMGGSPMELLKTGEREFEIQGGYPGDEGVAFLEACYEENFVQSFDWMEWVSENSDTVKTEEFARTADLKHLVMLITAHLRMDHFQNDHLYHKIQDGTIQILLQRLAELRPEFVREHR